MAIAIYALILLFGFLIIFLDCKDKRALRLYNEKIKLQRDVFLQTQNSLPKSRVLVKTKNGKTLRSALFDPSAEIYWLPRGDAIDYKSSKDIAQIEIEVTFRRGYYYDYMNLQYIPVCEIEEMKVVQD